LKGENMAVTTTGSLIASWLPSLKKGLLPSGTYSAVGPRFGYVDGNPDGVLTSTTGSDVVYDIGGGLLYIGDMTNGAGGSSWYKIGSTT